MTYERFERLVLYVGAAAIIGAMTISLGRRAVLEELAGQVLLLVVLIGAVHWGRRGGFLAAVVASSAYFAIRVPTVVSEGGLTADVASMLAVRVGAYGVIGILGGELCGRIRYIFARLEDASRIDEWTRVFNQRAVARSIAGCHGQHLRYGSEYSVVLLALAPQLTAELRVSRQKSLLRRVANHVRTDLRLVDEVGRLDDGRFCAVLPQTGRSGALVAAERVRTGVRELLGARDASVTVEVLGTPDDVGRLASLLEALAPEEAPAAGQDEPASSVA
ncbi:MAG: diguanylate cyclase [Coriobacteriia bacterium]|nr:diguanylate cyclase [Coriobacteriia bacterium]